MSDETSGWPVELRGITETIVATLGPNDRWNVAALGVHAPDVSKGGSPASDGTGEAATATTWGTTRTRRNFHREGGGVVQFTTDPLDFVDAALSIREAEDPVLDSADAWVEVSAESVATGESDGTTWERWALTPVESEVRRTRVPTVNRGFGAVVDATVAASRLDVPAYDTAELVDRLRYFEMVVERCGGPDERAAFERLSDYTDWRASDDSA